LCFIGSGGWIWRRRKSAYYRGVRGKSLADIDYKSIVVYNELMRVHFKPKTRLGKRSAWLLVTLAVLMGVFRINILLGQRGGDTFFSNPSLAIPILLAGISGIAAFITGLMSIIREKERSISVYLAVAVGLIVLIVALAQIISPH